MEATVKINRDMVEYMPFDKKKKKIMTIIMRLVCIAVDLEEDQSWR